MKKNKTEKKASFKRSILHITEHIILNEGYQSLSTRKISHQLGCAVGSLYNSYENLSDIVLRVNQRTLTRLHDQFKEYLKNNNTCPSELLIGLGTIYMKFWESHYQLANALFNYTQPQKKPLPEWAQQDVDAVFITIIQTMAPIKENLSEQPQTIAAILWAGLHGIATLCFSEKINVISSETQVSLAHSFIHHYMKGVTIIQKTKTADA